MGGRELITVHINVHTHACTRTHTHTHTLIVPLRTSFAVMAKGNPTACAIAVNRPGTPDVPYTVKLMCLVSFCTYVIHTYIILHTCIWYCALTLLSGHFILMK